MCDCKYDKRHGGPYDRGSADRYYGRPYNPHYYIGDTGKGQPITPPMMIPEEVAAYKAGWDEETDRKDWGR